MRAKSNPPLTTEQQNRLRLLCKGRVAAHVSMKRYTTFGIGGKADLICYPGSGEHVRHVVQFLDECGLPFLVVGSGSNLLVRDGGIRIPIIRLTEGFGSIWKVARQRRDVVVAAGAGVTLKKWTEYCIQEGFAGSEFLCGIPGSIGGALTMNAGTMGTEIKDITKAVTYIAPGGTVETRDREELTFGYRHLALPPQSIILQATFNLREEPPRFVTRAMKKNMKWREDAFPSGHPSAGCIFLNPAGGAAGKLIDKAGLKGTRIGKAQISEKHANFIVNLGGATAEDVLSLIALAKKRVFERSGIRLIPEVRIVGEPFEDR
jgi:UDP-N-acetylmuramate dehydrogenase